MLLSPARLLLPLLLLGSVLPAQEPEDASAAPQGTVWTSLPAVPGPLRRAVLREDWPAALAELTRLEEEQPAAADFWLYLRGHLQGLMGEPARGIATLRILETEHPDSLWSSKARFRMAELYQDLGRLEEAETLFETEARRLRSGERQGELAGVYLRFGDRWSTEAEAGKEPQPKLDYARAYALYQGVLGLDAPAALRERARERMGYCMMRLQRWQEAIREDEAFLAEFDPERARPHPGGDPLRVLEVQERLARSWISAGSPAEARRRLEDLQGRLRAALAGEGFWGERFAGAPAETRARLEKLRGEAAWQLGRTWNAGDAWQARLRISVWERLLEEMPGHPRAVEAAFQIARTLEDQGRLDDARAAFAAFLARPLPGGLSQEQREEAERLRREAVFRSGGLLARLGRHDEAIQVFQDYVARFPNGAHWAAAQQAIVESEYARGQRYREEREWEAARRAFEAFLVNHPLDPRAPELMLQLGDLAREEAESAEAPVRREALYREAVERWSRVVSKYPESDFASRALYAMGLVQEEKLGDLEAAIRSYARCRSGTAAGQAARRLQEMTRPSLRVLTERTWRSDEAARVQVQTRNLETLEVALYPLDLEAYFRKHLTHQRIEDLDLDLIAPAKRWEEAVPGYARYKPLEFELELPVEGPGVWAVAVTAGEFRATTLLLRSDLDVVVKSSRREVFVYAQDMLREEPAAGVHVLIGAPAPAGERLFEAETGADGVARLSLEVLRERDQVRVLALRDGHVAANGLGLSGLGLARGLEPRAYVSTDRSAYRPGQEVHWRAVLREVRDGRYAFDRERPWTVRVLDSQGRPFHEETAFLGPYGTLHGSAVLDARAPLGEYRVTVSSEDEEGLSWSTTFQVQDFELQKVELTLETVRPVYYRGEEVEVTAVARWYYGAPVAEAELQWWAPDGTSGSVRTGDDGRATFRFETRAFPAEGPLGFRALLPQEGVQASGTVHLAILGFRASVSTPRDLYLLGDSLPVEVRSKDPAGEPVARALELVVLRRESRPGGTWAEVEVERRPFETAAEDGRARLTVQPERGGSYILRVEGRDRFGNRVAAETAVFVSGEEDEQKLRIVAERQDYEVGETAEVVVVNRARPGLALLSFEAENVLEHRLVRLDSGATTLRFPLEHAHFPNFVLAVSYMEGNRFHQASAEFRVGRRLQVRVEVPDTAWRPGGEAEVILHATDQLGHPVQAELSLAVVDAALFDLFPDARPGLRAVFEEGTRRDAALRTASSCTFRYQGVTRRIAAEILAEAERRAREEAWKEEGEAVVERLAEIARGAAAPAPSRPRRGIFDGVAPGANSAEPQLADLDALSAFGYAGGGGGGGGRYGGRGQAAARAKSYQGPGDAGPPAFAKDSMESAWVLGQQLRLYDDKAGVALRNLGDLGIAPQLALGMERLDAEVRAELLAWFRSEAAFWAPAVETDESGQAVVRFVLPPRSTRWRLHALGVGPETLLGEAEREVTARDEFFVELDLPASLVEGDRPEPRARVHHLGEAAATVDLQLRVTREDGSLVQSLPRTAEAVPGGVTEVRFEGLEAFLEPGRYQVELRAEAGGGGLRAQSRRAVEVRPWGIELVDAASGILSQGTTLSLDLGERARGRSLEVHLGPDLQRLLVDEISGSSPVVFRHLRHWSTLLDSARHLQGLAAVLEHLETAAGSSHPDHARLLSLARAQIARLVATQLPDGGWPRLGVRGDTEAHPETSAEAMIALAEARRRGLRVPDATREQGLRYLETAFRAAGAGEDERKAVLVLARALQGEEVFAETNRLHRERNRLPLAALADTVRALAAQGRGPMAAEAAAVLAARQAEDGSWAAAAEKAAPWNRNGLELTARAVLALEAAGGHETEVARAAGWLHGHRPWWPPRVRGLVVTALARYHTRVLPARTAQSLAVRIEDGAWEEIVVPGGGPPVVLRREIPGESGPVRVEFRYDGRGAPTFHAVLRGLGEVRELRDPDRGLRITAHRLVATPPRARGREVPDGFSVLRRPEETWRNEVRHLPAGEAAVLEVAYDTGVRDARESEPLVLEVPLPAGTRLLEDTVQGSFRAWERAGGTLVFQLWDQQSFGWVRFRVLGSVPGEWKVPPARLRSAVDPSRQAWDTGGALSVLRPGETSPDPWRPTPDALFHLGKAAWEDGETEAAQEALGALFRDFEPLLREEVLTELSRMLLDLAIREGEAQGIVRFFEVLKEKDPGFTLPFDQIVAVGEAYRRMEEFERALLIFRATVEETFGRDLQVASALEAHGEIPASLELIQRLWLDYPDLPVVQETALALADRLLTRAPEAWKEPSLRAAGLSGPALRREGILLLQRLLTLHPRSPLAPEAGLNLVSAFLDLEDYATTTLLAQELGERFGEPRYADAFRYTQAVAEWYLGQDQRAMELLEAIARSEFVDENGRRRPSENRELAWYILAQIHHARQEIEEASAYYERVARLFSDAREVLEGFRERRLALEEITRARPGEAAHLRLRSRNLEEAELLVYQVDLLTLYLRERNLSGITSVNLAGIAPALRRTVELGKGIDLEERETSVPLELPEAGAWLVIARSGGLHASGMVLISDLDLRVREDPASGRLRVQVVHRPDGRYLRDVEIRVVGSGSPEFVAGRTDPRGIFVADGIQGAATVVARGEDGHFAFYRGRTPLGAVAAERPQEEEVERDRGRPDQGAEDYFQNIRKMNKAQQMEREKRFRSNVERSIEGVRVGRVD